MTNIDIGGVLDRTFKLYRDQLTLLIPAALVVFIVPAIIAGVVRGSAFGALIAIALTFVAGYWYQGMIVEAARDMLDGRRDQTVGSLLTSVTPVIVPLLIAGVLAGIAITIGFVLLIVPGLFLLTIWAVLAPVLVIERTDVFAAFGRSQELVSGNGWPVLGVLVILFVLTFVASAILGVIFGAIGVVGSVIASLLTQVLITPLTALAAAVLYFDLRAIADEPVAAGATAGTGPAEPGPAQQTA